MALKFWVLLINTMVLVFMAWDMIAHSLWCTGFGMLWGAFTSLVMASELEPSVRPR